MLSFWARTVVVRQQAKMIPLSILTGSLLAFVLTPLIEIVIPVVVVVCAGSLCYSVQDHPNRPLRISGQQFVSSLQRRLGGSSESRHLDRHVGHLPEYPRI